MATGKWIGCVLGAMKAGPLGALFGLIIGSLYDYFTESHEEVTYPNESERRTYQQQGERNSFLFSLMVLAADVIHADGRIMHSEMEYVRRFLRSNFSNEAEQEGEAILLRLFEEKKKEGTSAWSARMNAICRQLAANMPEEHRLQLVAFLCEIAKADGSVAQQEHEALRRICLGMGLDPRTAEQLMGLGGSNLDDAYKLLGITADCTDDEVRRAYKKMAMQHHPDRVAHLGEDIRKASEKKFQEINDAKERIYKSRNMK